MRWYVHRELTEELPDGKPAMTDIVQRRGRSHGRGIPDCAVWPVNDRRPCVDPGQPQTNIRICGKIRESELGHRRLKASSPPLHDYRIEDLPRRLWRGWACCTSVLDKGHQSALRRGDGAMRYAYCALRRSVESHGRDKPGHDSEVALRFRPTPRRGSPASPDSPSWEP